MTKKIIKRVILSILILLALVFVAIAVALNFIFTPEKLTPIVSNIAKEYVKSEISIGSVELTFFSTFPNFSAQIDSLKIKQKIDEKRTGNVSDFISSKKCIVSFNPFSFINKKIVINRILLEDPNIYLYTDSLYSSLDLFALDQVAEPSDTLETTFDYQLIVRGVEIDSSTVTIDDRNKQFYSKLDGFSMTVDGDLSYEIVDFDLYLNWDNLLIWQKNEVLLNMVSLNLNSKMKFRKDSLLLTLEKTDLTLNNIALTASGVIRGDSTTQSLDVDIHSTLSTPSLSEFLNLVPATIIDSKETIETTGSVDLDLSIKGTYSESSTPNAVAKLSIKDAKARYQSRKISINDVDCDAEMFLSLNNPEESYIDINNLHINSSDILDLTVKGRVDNILKNPAVDIKVKSDIYFSRLIEMFPLEEGVKFEGENHSNIDAKFTLEDIETSNYGKIYLEGESMFKDLVIAFNLKEITKDSSSTFVYVEMSKGEFLFGNRVVNRVKTELSTLTSFINFTGLGFKNKLGEFVYVRNLRLSAGAQLNKNTKKVDGIGVKLELQKINAGIEKQIDLKMSYSKIKLIIRPEREQEMKIDATLQSDSISLTEVANNSDLNISLAGMKFTLTKSTPKGWGLQGNLGFSNLTLYSDLFPLNIDIPATNLVINDREIKLNKAHMKMGSSDIIATGHIKNLIRKFFSTEKDVILSGKLAIASEKLDIGEFIEATNKSVLFSSENTDNVSDTANATIMIDTTVVKVDTITNDSVLNPMILIPKNINIDLDLDINKMVYDQLEAGNFIGRATMKNGVLSLNQLSLEILGAKAFSSMTYKNVSHDKSHMFIDLSLADVDINKIGNLIPSIDSMIPMLKTFEGVVNFDFKAAGNMDSDMNFNIPSLRGAIEIDGQNLVLMDSETFKDISKMLRFKNKNRNFIDSLSVQVIIEDSRVDIFPFNVTIDRYKAIVGGTQTISVDKEFKVDFKYNVSIMKSPLPFKAGVDIFGDLNDFDFKITKAKLKKTDFKLQYKSFEKFKKSIE